MHSQGCFVLFKNVPRKKIPISKIETLCIRLETKALNKTCCIRHFLLASI